MLTVTKLYAYDSKELCFEFNFYCTTPAFLCRFVYKNELKYFQFQELKCVFKFFEM